MVLVQSTHEETLTEKGASLDQEWESPVAGRWGKEI